MAQSSQEVHTRLLKQQSGKKRTGRSRSEFKGENMKNMFTLYDDFVAKMLGKYHIYKVRFGLDARLGKPIQANLAQCKYHPPRSGTHVAV